ncbi:hypothetical protein [Glycomyces salinus]|uniref:hypothetical protein n=1 Tax=Glycomyces salinus TaxID=980294 RepID=UPI0018ED7E08|nr:hypothetical protein [Glycomyces salinus]
MKLRITSILAAAVFALTACGQAEDGGGSSQDPSDGSGGGSSQDPSNGSGSDAPPTMPEASFSVTETDDELEVVFEATVEIESDGSWERTGDGPDSGSLTAEQVARIDELSQDPDFPEDLDNDLMCTAVEPSYGWALTVGEDTVTNAQGGCAFSEPAVEIVDIIQEAADVGPTL